MLFAITGSVAVLIEMSYCSVLSSFLLEGGASNTKGISSLLSLVLVECHDVFYKVSLGL